MITMERHAVFFLMYNLTEAQLELSKQALDSILRQDIGPLDVYVVNNGSTAPTKAWLDSLNPDQTNGSWLYIRHSTYNVSPIKLANDYAATLFQKYDKVLGVPNDCVLPKSTYRLLSEIPRGFVSATPIEDQSPLFTIPEVETATVISECTPMAVMVTRKWAYDALIAKDGFFFDERYFHWASDCDLALRMAACGIRGCQTDVKFWHYRSASWRLASPADGKRMTDGADADREQFRLRWGFKVDDPQYHQKCGDINFRG